MASDGPVVRMRHVEHVDTILYCMSKIKPLKISLVCSGLGRVSRGFESFAQECFDALTDVPDLDITLFKGGGPAQKKQIPLWNIPRDSWIATQLGRKLGRGGYQIEQLTFCLSLLPHVMRQKPDVIYFSDGSVGNVLWHWRRRTRQNFKLLFSNGGPVSPPFPRWDHVQQVAPTHLEAANAAGQETERQSLVPYGIRMDAELAVLSSQERREVRTALGLPVDRPIVLSVGAVNTGHKRIDYVVRELAAVSQPRPYLLMLGQQDMETETVRQLAENHLGSENFAIRTVSQPEVDKYYRSADISVLASLSEGLPRVLLEALSHGLPCLVHDYELTRYVLGNQGFMADLTRTGRLAELVCHALKQGESLEKRQMRHQSCFERFSWSSLRPDYIAMIKKCAAETTIY